MRVNTIAARQAELQADSESIEWTERVALVSRLLEGSSRARALGPEAKALIALLADDPKWEVRKAVAANLHKLSEDDFAGFAAKLTSDDNAYVKAAADRAMGQRRKGHSSAAKRSRGLNRNEKELRILEQKHGAEAAAMVGKMAQRMYEGLVGASVHEMRSVLTAMKMNIEKLAEAAEGETYEMTRRVYPRLSRSVAFLERLLGDMRVYTQGPPRKTATERVCDIGAEATEMVQAEFTATGRDFSPVTLTAVVSGELVFRIARDRIVLALRNLIKNAYDAFMLDEVSFSPGTIEIDAAEGPDGVVIRIRDDGMGLSSEELENVRQFVPGRSSKENLGTGFGLPIARNAIRAHGGDLRIESEEDEGTEVTVWLPVDFKRKS